MGYYAHGYGCLKLNSQVPEDILGLLSFENAGFSNIIASPDGELSLIFEDEKYYEDCVTDAMEKIAPYVTSGAVEFCGEDDAHWRYYFHDGKMEQQRGEVVYKAYKPTRVFRVVFLRLNEDPNINHEYYVDGVSIRVDNGDMECMFVDLINKFEQYVDENNIQDVSVNEIYEEE